MPDMELDSDDPDYTPPRNPTGGFNHPFGGPGGMGGMGMGGIGTGGIGMGGGGGGGGTHDFLPADVNAEEARMLEAVMMGVPYTGHIPDFEAQAAVRFPCLCGPVAFPLGENERVRRSPPPARALAAN